MTLGTEEAVGVVPEGLSLSADMQGPASCSFTLRRPADVVWSELQAANQVQVDVDGVPVWGGRINQTPASGKGVGEQIAVSAQGWAAHLGDDQGTRKWVTQSMAGWADVRGSLSANLAAMTAAGTVTTDGGVTVIGWPKGSPVATANAVGVMRDLGPGNTADRVYVDMMVTSPDANVTAYVIGSDDPWWAHGSRLDYSANATNIYTAGTWYTLGGTIATPRRYVTVILWYGGGAGTWGTDVLAKIKGCRIGTTATVSNTTYDSTLTASQVVTDTLGWGAAPLLDAVNAQVTATSFVIPEFAPDGYRTPREIIEAVNAYHDYVWGVDALRRPYWRARPTDPLFEVGSFSGGQFDDASLGNLDRIYNRVIVEYTGADGVPATVSRTNTSTILTRQGLTRTYRLSVQATLTPAAAQQIGDVWLTKHVDAPLSGSITVAPGDIRTTQGVTVHPSILLTKVGERVRLTGQIDPVTGDVGRVGTIVSVNYNPAAETAQLQLDNDTQSLEAWLARLALIQGTGR